MQNVEHFTPTKQEEAASLTYELSKLMDMNPRKGSWAWRLADQITGWGDYTAADEGSHPDEIYELNG